MGKIKIRQFREGEEYVRKRRQTVMGNIKICEDREVGKGVGYGFKLIMVKLKAMWDRERAKKWMAAYVYHFQRPKQRDLWLYLLYLISPGFDDTQVLSLEPCRYLFRGSRFIGRRRQRCLIGNRFQWLRRNI